MKRLKRTRSELEEELKAKCRIASHSDTSNLYRRLARKRVAEIKQELIKT